MLKKYIAFFALLLVPNALPLESARKKNVIERLQKKYKTRKGKQRFVRAKNDAAQPIKKQNKKRKRQSSAMKRKIILHAAFILFFITYLILTQGENHDENDALKKADEERFKGEEARINKLFEDIFAGNCNTLVEKPSPNSEFKAKNGFDFGATEVVWNEALGTLQEIPLEQCKVNPNLIHTTLGQDVDLSSYPSVLYPDDNATGKKLVKIFARAGFSEHDTFDNYQSQYQRAHNKEDFKNALGRFDYIMEIENPYQPAEAATKKTMQMFHYMVDQMDKLDVGQNNEGTALTDKQKNNQSKLRTLFREFPTMMRECKAIINAFIGEAAKQLNLNSDRAATFTGELYTYLQSYMSTQLDSAVTKFVIRRAAYNKGKPLDRIASGFSSTCMRQHIINGFKKSLTDYLRIDGVESMTGSYYSEFVSFTCNNAYDDEKEAVVKMFLQYFFAEYFSVEKIVKHLAVAIPSTYNSDIKMTSYATFAHKKGVIASSEREDWSPLYADETYEKVDEKTLIKILYNTKVFRRKT